MTRLPSTQHIGRKKFGCLIPIPMFTRREVWFIFARCMCFVSDCCDCYSRGHWSCFSGHASLHTLLLALFTPPAFYCHPGMKEIKQDAAVPRGSYHADRSTIAIMITQPCFTLLVGHLLRTRSYALLTWTVGCVVY